MNHLGDSGSNSTTFDKVKSADELAGDITGDIAYKYPVIKYSPEEIFSNKVPLLDINFINPSSEEDRNSAHALQETVASWYLALRNLALVGMLSVLVYTGIRIMLTSVAAEKAKYKTMLKDWLIGICILLFLHYIMYFILLFSEKLTEIIGPGGTNSILVNVDRDTFSTNLMGLTRFLVQYKKTWSRIIYLFMYAFMVWYTIRFSWMYLKRVATMAFLTIIAPLVAFLYPIDKLNGSNAMGFNNLMKQYSLNALIQPFHKLLYTVLVTSAMSLVTENPLYAVVVFAFIAKAMDMMFNEFLPFGKGGAFMMGSILGASGASKGSSSKSSHSSSSSSTTNEKIRTKPSPDDRSGKDKTEKPKLSKEERKPRLEEGKDEDEEKRKKEEEKKKKEEQLKKDAEIKKKDEEVKKKEEQLKKDIEEKKQQEEEEEAIRKQKEKEDEIKKKDEEDESNKKEKPDSESKSFKGPKKEQKQKYKKPKEKKSVIKGMVKTAPAALYKGARGTAKLASMGAMGAAGGLLGLTKGAIRFGTAAATGDIHAFQKGIQGAKGGLSSGVRFGSKAFDKTVGRGLDATLGKASGGNGRLVDQYRKSAYGSNRAAKNALSDKAIMKDSDYEDYLRSYNPDATSRQIKQMKYDHMDYRKKTGITDKDLIRKGLEMEKEYMEKEHYSQEDARLVAQNAIGLASKSKISDKAWTDTKTYKAEKDNIAETLGNIGNKDEIAESIMQTIKKLKYK